MEENEVWFAEFKKLEAEKFLQSIEGTLERTKARATNLLGWMITLTVAMGTVSFTQSNPNKILAVIMFFGFLTTAILCVRALYSTKWDNYELYPSVMDKVKDDCCNNKIKVLNKIAQRIEECIDYNKKQVIYIQKYMRCAWILLIATPIFTLFVFILCFFCLS